MEDKNSDTLEIAKLGYEMAIQLWIYEGNSIWSKFNAMLVVHTIGMAVATQVQNPNHHIIVGGAGLILCCLWYFMHLRGFETIDYWINTSKELEATYFIPVLNSVHRGGDFASGDKVEFVFSPDKTVSLKANKYHVKFRVRCITYLITALFAVIYICILWNGLCQKYCKKPSPQEEKIAIQSIVNQEADALDRQDFEVWQNTYHNSPQFYVRIFWESCPEKTRYYNNFEEFKASQKGEFNKINSIDKKYVHRKTNENIWVSSNTALYSFTLSSFEKETMKLIHKSIETRVLEKNKEEWKIVQATIIYQPY